MKLETSVNKKIKELNTNAGVEFATCVSKIEMLIKRSGVTPTPRELARTLGPDMQKVVTICKDQELAYECLVGKAKSNLLEREQIQISFGELKIKRSKWFERNDQRRKCETDKILELSPHVLMGGLIKIYESSGGLSEEGLKKLHLKNADLKVLYKKFGCKNLSELVDVVRTEYVYFNQTREHENQMQRAYDEHTRTERMMVEKVARETRKYRYWTADEVKAYLLNFYKENRRFPSDRWFNRTKDAPSIVTVKRKLGPRSGWLEAIGITKEDEIFFDL